MEPSPHDTAIIVHLVHGTFAREAEWIQPDSALAESVKACLGQDILIMPFNWSGSNYHSARSLAGEQLAQRIRDTEREHHGAAQYIIAHSHGGNVAAYASCKPDISSKINAVACLGTPFIRTHSRDLVGSRRLLQWILSASAVTVLLLVISILYLAATLPPDALINQPPAAPPLPDILTSPPWSTVLTTFSAILLASGVGWLLSRPVVWLWRFLIQNGLPALETMQSDIGRQLNARFGDTPVLIVDAKGDEAAWWLTLISRLAALPYHIWRPSGFMLAGMLLISILAVTLIFLNFDATGNMPSYPFMLFVFPFFFFVVSTSIVAGTGWLLCLILPAFVRSNAIGFGRDDFFKNFIVEISSAQTPEQSGRVNRQTVAVNGKGLHHSRLYQEERIFRILCEWFRPVSADNNLRH